VGYKCQNRLVLKKVLLPLLNILHEDLWDNRRNVYIPENQQIIYQKSFGFVDFYSNICSKNYEKLKKMEGITEILYDFEKSKSLQVYPKKQRKKLKDMNGPVLIKTHKALNASEKELKHLMEVANRRLERVHKIVQANADSGYHLEEEVFIPEYLGFTDVPPEDAGDVRIYSRSGYNMARLDDKWVITGPNNLKATIKIKNMFEAIIILGSMGLDVNVTDYMDAKYRDDKPVEEIIVEVQDKVIAARTLNTLPDGK